ncbi:hypothetical protein [Paenibacillus sp. FSL H8-0079]|uniref:hypothetical protein n=1 Tax=Paenibacillus sp. FSL H8-0079 TaxID=2921375 RepID=UPI0030EEFA97
MKYTKACLIVILIILCSTGCGTREMIEINYNVQEIPNHDFMLTVNNYFQHFDDIRRWKDYTTETYVKSVYAWCTGDYTEEATVDEMVKVYYQLNKDSLKLESVDINNIEVSENDEILIEVSRTWEDGQKDESTYSILFENEGWKIDDRM